MLGGFFYLILRILWVRGNDYLLEILAATVDLIVSTPRPVERQLIRQWMPTAAEAVHHACNALPSVFSGLDKHTAAGHIGTPWQVSHAVVHISPLGSM